MPSSSPHHLAEPALKWLDDVTLKSKEFDDFYFSSADGLNESSYVFIDGIGGQNYWVEKDTLTIGETGFGTGLNFLNLWKQWQQNTTEFQRLHYMSVEAFPLTTNSIKKALSVWPELTPFVDQLVEVYPEHHPGIHRLILDQGRVILTLLFGDAAQMLSQVQGQLDGWFLDGFSPSQNDLMWTNNVYSQIARLSKPDAKLATFTAAGHVRRGLESVGFNITKRAGFGIKRECMHGVFIPKDAEPSHKDGTKRAPWFAPTHPISKKSKIAIIGGGIAGLSLANSLKIRGFIPTIFESAVEAGSVGSGNAAGLVQPRLTAANSLDGQFNAMAFLHATRRYSGRALGPEVWLDKRGVLQLARNAEEEKRFQRLIRESRLPANIMQLLSPKEASDVAQIEIENSALYFPTGGCINPKSLVLEMANAFKKSNQFKNNHLIKNLEFQDNGWILSGSTGEENFTTEKFDAAVLANGPFANQTWPDWDIPLHAKRGQVNHFLATDKSSPLACALAFDGYISPAYEVDGEMVHISGASYANFDQNPKPEERGRTANWRRLLEEDQKEISDNINIHLDHLGLHETSDTKEGRAGLRATVPDHLPILGPIPDHGFYEKHYDDLHHGKHVSRYPEGQMVQGLYCLTGLGSRGVQTSPLLCEALADLMTGEPCALPIDQLAALHPARFQIRTLKKPPHLRNRHSSRDASA